jgi:hypothetical protein
MARWYDVLVPNAKDEEDPVLLYSLQTRLGELQILATLATFRIALSYGTGTLWLALNESRSVGLFEDTCDAVVAASRHQSGITELDTSDEKVSDYLLDWKVRVSQRMIFNYIDLWVHENPDSSLREMVDYFEHDATHLVNRENIGGFLEEMIVSGQMKRLPRDWMTPAELDRILLLAKEYGVELPDNRYC